jgi:hypothetical protein
MVDLDPGWVSGKLIASSTRKRCPNKVRQNDPLPIPVGDGGGFGRHIRGISIHGFDGVVCAVSLLRVLNTILENGLERVEIRAVNAPIVADGQLVAALDVTAAADGCDSPVRQDGVD